MYILCVAALLGACDITQDGYHINHHILPKIRNYQKKEEIENFVC